MSKTKVAPLKQLSIPKLELQGAVLGTRVAQTISKMHSFKIHETMFLTDSRVVLAWITTRKLKLKQFVALRISEILDTTTRSQWFHIGSKHNVADDGTKFSDPTMGNISERWFQGPDFLKKERSEWPIKAAWELAATEPEVEMVGVHRAVEPKFEVLDKVNPRMKSKWLSYVRVVANIIKFGDLTRKERTYRGTNDAASLRQTNSRARRIYSSRKCNLKNSLMKFTRFRTRKPCQEEAD